MKPKMVLCIVYWYNVIIFVRQTQQMDSHPDVQNFLADTVAAFGLLLNRKLGGAAARGGFSNVFHLKKNNGGNDQDEIRRTYICLTNNKVHTMSSKMLVPPVLLRLLDLLDE